MSIEDVEVGDKIRAKGSYLRCNGGFDIDLSDWVTVRKRDDGVLMAGWLSLSSYANKNIEILNK